MQGRWSDIKRIAALPLALFLFFFTPFFAQAAVPQDFINDPSAWIEYADDITVLPYYKEGGYSGICSYYSDIENRRVYFHLSYSESGLEKDKNDVSVILNIRNGVNEYRITVEKDGLVYESEKPPFDAEVNFGEATEQGQEIYFCLEFKNKNDKKEKNYLNISVSANGKTYTPYENIMIDYSEKDETTVKSTTESTSGTDTETTGSSAKSKSSAKESETKYKYSGNAQLQSAAGTEKYSGTLEQTQRNTTKNESESNKSVSAEMGAQAEIKSVLSPTSKALLGASAVCLTAGIVIIARSFIAPNAKNKKN